MLINGINISTYGAIHQQHDIQTAEVITYQDWLRNASNFIITGQKETYKAITCDMIIKGADDDDILQKISNLIKQAEKCTIQFDGTVFLYDAFIKVTDHKRLDYSHKVYTLHIEWQSGYAYKPEITEILDRVTSKTITVLGNLPTPAMVTITPSTDTISTTLTGLSKNPITINKLHANTDVVIDGEKYIVTEADIDATITEITGLNKWNFRKYNMVRFVSPDSMYVYLAPHYSTIPTDTLYTQQLITDAATLIKNVGMDYLGYLKTAVSVAVAKTITFDFYHDDGLSIYLNGVEVFTKDTFESDLFPETGIGHAVLNLNAGWNTIEILYIEHTGQNGVWGITPTIGSQVDSLNCYYSRESGITSVVNKFGDTDMWSFPILQPGANALIVSDANSLVTVRYKPKFI